MTWPTRKHLQSRPSSPSAPGCDSPARAPACPTAARDAVPPERRGTQALARSAPRRTGSVDHPARQMCSVAACQQAARWPRSSRPGCRRAAKAESFLRLIATIRCAWKYRSRRTTSACCTTSGADARRRQTLDTTFSCPRAPRPLPDHSLTDTVRTLHEPHIDWAAWWAKRGYAVVTRTAAVASSRKARSTTPTATTAQTPRHPRVIVRSRGTTAKSAPAGARTAASSSGSSPSSPART